jgi:uncharacterized radical SAM superfamily Fe-S cluster-containing enzyme
VFLPAPPPRARRYTTSQLAHDLHRHTGGKIDAHRDWFPLGAMGAFGALADHLRSLNGPEGPRSFGAVGCSCHPNCGASVVLVANKNTKVWAPVTQFFDLWRFMQDIEVICDTARGKALSWAQVALAFFRNFDQSKCPPGFSLGEFIKLFFFGKMRGAMGREIKEKDWRVLWVGGMWFQDLWTYDFRRTEMCVIPYATQEGEISFCAYNTGVGWRQIVENMHTVARTKAWFETRGRHQVYAGNKPIDLEGRRKLPILGAGPAVAPGAHLTNVG